MKKRKIVLNDKSKIASLIAELDEKKSEALKKAYVQVTRVCFSAVQISILLVVALSLILIFLYA